MIATNLLGRMLTNGEEIVAVDSYVLNDKYVVLHVFSLNKSTGFIHKFEYQHIQVQTLNLED